MSKFISNELETFDFEDGEWIKISKEFSLEDSEKMAKMGKEDNTWGLLTVIIKEWNFKDANGDIVPLNIENIKRLKIEVFKKISEIISKKLTLDKKKLPISSEPLGDTEPVPNVLIT